ncbi:hypothetical protein ARMGADRAFT_342844 [Armillaria gallica]|uniref:Uncharacterized protein n=1 Tax=Armillaria gallica TaxID=47427 RepID=A0A2H3DK26_ARMGA|nr:hypothetical protein ARMGADRAFT_342844 [Armillaria gallica]
MQFYSWLFSCSASPVPHIIHSGVHEISCLILLCVTISPPASNADQSHLSESSSKPNSTGSGSSATLSNNAQCPSSDESTSFLLRDAIIFARLSKAPAEMQPLDICTTRRRGATAYCPEVYTRSLAH